MLVMGEQFSGSKFVQLDVTAEIITLPESMERLAEWHPRVRGEHPNWDQYRTRIQEEKRILIRVTIEKVARNVRTLTARALLSHLLIPGNVIPEP
jgi:hypothetical protein